MILTIVDQERPKDEREFNGHNTTTTTIQLTTIGTTTIPFIPNSIFLPVAKMRASVVVLFLLCLVPDAKGDTTTATKTSTDPVSKEANCDGEDSDNADKESNSGSGTCATPNPPVVTTLEACRNDPTWQTLDYQKCQELMEWLPRGEWWNQDQVEEDLTQHNHQALTTCFQDAWQQVSVNDQNSTIFQPRQLQHYQ